MPCFIECTITRVEHLNPERIRKIISSTQPAVFRYKKSIVLAHPAVITSFIPVHPNIAEKYTYSIRSFHNFTAEVLAIPQKSLLFPYVTNQIPRHSHFRKYHHLRVFRACFSDHVQHLPTVQIRPAGDDLHLTDCYSKQECLTPIAINLLLNIKIIHQR
ncbi:MAG: hypothetical protein BWY65_02006 [Firmicutes bacterium ADurb.Bin373]|nr:MAG: hypothetical protein BWY65_02006 [Firmicutes bacterium ADurb.Bin373]